jgi:hypothetical protein
VVKKVDGEWKVTYRQELISGKKWAVAAGASVTVGDTPFLVG